MGDAPITSLFKGDRSKCQPTCSKDHGGTDYGVPVGTPVQATASGTVVKAYYSSSFGGTVIINHKNIENEGVYTLYAHSADLKVKNGQQVEAGEVIMLSGKEGIGTGPHLHYEVIKSPLSVNSNDFYKKDKLNYRYGPDELSSLLN